MKSELGSGSAEVEEGWRMLRREQKLETGLGWPGRKLALVLLIESYGHSYLPLSYCCQTTKRERDTWVAGDQPGNCPVLVYYFHWLPLCVTLSSDFCVASKKISESLNDSTSSTGKESRQPCKLSSTFPRTQNPLRIAMTAHLIQRRARQLIHETALFLSGARPSHPQQMFKCSLQYGLPLIWNLSEHAYLYPNVFVSWSTRCCLH